MKNAALKMSTTLNSFALQYMSKSVLTLAVVNNPLCLYLLALLNFTYANYF